MNGRPLVAITCCWIIGVSILSLCQGLDAVLALGALLLLLTGLGLYGQINLKLLIMCCLALMLASGERYWVEHRNTSDLAITEATEGAEAVLSGTIASIIEVDGDLVTFRLKAKTIRLASPASEQKMSDTVMIRIKLSKQSEQTLASKWKREDAITVKGIMELPGDAGNFGAFDYRNYLKKQGIHWQLTAKGTHSVNYSKGETPLIGKPLRALDDLRNAIGGLMDRLFPHGDAGYMKGLVVGIRSDLNPEQFDDFARLGLTHVLAISGLHVGVVVFLLLQTGAWLRLTRERTLDLTIAMMPLYMMITGASPSAVRACLMAMLALWLARRHALKDGLHLLLSAALLMLIWNPSLVEDVSFQLSFIVTAGLILFVPTVTESLPIPWKWLRAPLAVTLTAQVVSFPLTIYYFHAAHLLSLPANFFLVPFISFIVMPLGMASIVLGALWFPMGIIPAKLATMGNQLTFHLVEWLNGFSRLRTVWPQPSLLWVVTAYFLMGIGVVLLKRRLAVKQEREWWSQQAADEGILTNPEDDRTAPLAFEYRQPSRNQLKSTIYKVGIAALYLVWIVWGYQPAWLDHSATISFINVGQGDSILIRTGEGKHILIDTGGTVSFHKPGEEWRARSDPYEVGRKLLVPLLLKRGIRELDALVLTHLDADHIGGAQAVIENIPIRSMLFNGTMKDSPAPAKLFQLALDHNIPCYSVHTDMEWKVDATTSLHALYPRAELTDSGNTIKIWKEQNERSIVLLISVYGRSFLLPGDLEAEGEREVVAAEDKTGNKHQRIDVLKAGHHGSKTSTTQEWLNYWQPVETVISVGRNNSYGHPHPTVLARLNASGSQIFRTDRDGEIQYRIHPDGTMKRRMVR
ncbi:DNA internalization-related competence protein ComEC/Rec2 [Cohnella silvisoli]|uniref:DNA internalization-related competence protein ComEC/Rec2 n=1 Tax=Cohnella silvisoli TaxID=2873699 RepID=A0ABV1KUR8_9BACL|nr:DNA internalization-related competence protein ComEC/Rec2 [Cohnella silvisoli]MCD9023035.1 DNA internalization-related competence protein ComEC/Rec2 [Cohnella silvisoli]